MSRGYTLAEICLAMFLIVVSFLAVAKVTPAVHRGVTAGKEHLIALSIARAAIERVRSLPWGADPSSVKGPVPWLDESVEGRAVSLEFAVKDVVVQLPPGGGLTPPGFGSVTVTVTWHQGVGQADNSGNNSLLMTGGLSREP